MHCAGLGWQSRRILRTNYRDRDYIQGIERGEYKARYQRAQKQISHPHTNLIAQYHQNQAGRQQLRHRPRRRNNAGRQLMIISIAQHDRQRQQPHHNDSGRDDSCCRRQQSPHQYHGQRQTAPHRTQQNADRRQ